MWDCDYWLTEQAEPEQAEPEPATTKTSMGGFDDINLGDTPQLNLSFGETETKNTGSGFGFGGWSSAWGTTSKWPFGATDTGTTDSTDVTKDTNDTSVNTGESDLWPSFGGNKKGKKKTTTTTTTGFNFGDLGTLDESADQNATAEVDEWAGFGKNEKKNKKKGALDEPIAESDNFGIGTAVEESAADNSWGTWGTAATKGKKKVKKDQNEEIPPVPPPPPADAAEADWTAFGTDSKRNKKKNKKGAADDHTEELAVPEPEADTDIGGGSFGAKKNKKGKKNQVEETSEVPAIVAVPEAPEQGTDMGWTAFGTGKNKDKKKGKKGAVEEPLTEPVVTLPGPELEADVGLDGFGASRRDKDKKKGKKNAFEESFETPAAPVPPESEPEPEPEPGFEWSGFGTSKKEKDKKKLRKGAPEETPEPSAIDTIPVPEPQADSGWSFGNKDKGKGKKGKKGELAKEDTAPPIVPEAESTLDAGWGTFGTKKDRDKKAKPKGFLDDIPDDINTTTLSDPDLMADDSLSAWGTTAQKGKKGKNGLISEVTEDPITAFESIAAAETPAADDNWMNWGSTDKKKDKKGKKGAVADTKKEEALPPPPPPPPVAPEPSAFENFGSTKKDKKGKKGATPEKAKEDIIAISDPVETVPEPVEEDFGGWGLSAKEKKKKEKEKEKERKEKEKEEKEKKELEEKEREEKEKAEKEKAKAKPGKKGKVTATAEISKTKDLMEDSVPDVPALEEDTWGDSIWGSSTKTKKKGGKNFLPDVPPPVPTPPALGLTPEPPDVGGLDDIGDNEWASFAPAKATGKASKLTSKFAHADDTKTTKKGTRAKIDEDAFAGLLGDNFDDEAMKKEPPKESAAKAAKSFWGSVGTASAAKSKLGKDKDREKQKEEEDQKAKDLLDLDDLDDDIIGIADETPKKGSKTKTDGKLAKTTSKASKNLSERKTEANDAFLDDLLELGDEDAALDQVEEKKDDAWSFWGSAKKTGGKKADEGKKEITKAEITNQKGSLRNNLKNGLEATTTALADEPSSQPAKTSKTAMLTGKVSKTSSVLQRVQDLEKEKEKAKGKPSEAGVQPPASELEPLSKTDSPPKKSVGAKTSKFAAASNSASAKKKDLSSPVDKVKDKKTSQDTVPGAFPGSFPAEGADDDILDIIDLPPADKKTNKKSAKPKKQEPDPMIMDEFDFDAPAPPLAPEAPPTPPPEKPAAKKERARIVRDQGASSWGFWGASPKKDTKESKSKDDAGAPPAKPKEKAAAPGLSRSKSTRTTAKDKEKEVEKSSKSSASDDKEKKSQSRPSKSRGSSFGGFFGGPPPVRAKTTRRPSTAASKTASSRRQSMDVDAVGLPSPPAEDAPEMNVKAAKLMGASPRKLDRKASTHGKPKPKGSGLNTIKLDGTAETDNSDLAVPDPYPIDDDDMVMIGGLGDPTDDPIANDPPTPKASIQKVKSSKSKPKKEVRQRRPPLRSISTLPVRSHPKQPSRGAWVKANHAHKQTKPADDLPDDIVMVDATSPQDELDGAKENLAFDERPHPKRADTSAKKSKGGMMGGLFGGFSKSRRASEPLDRPKSKGVLTEDEGLSRRKRPVTGTDDSAKRLRREDRKVRRSATDERAAEGYVYDAPASKDADDPEAQARKEARRAKREAEKAAEDARKLKAKDARERRARKEEEAEAIRLEEKRARRAAREEMNAKLGADPSSRPRKTDRRRSHMDPPISTADEDAERRARREARRAARTPGEKSRKNPVNDYFDPRNGADGGGEPYMNGNDHTSSWVKSQVSTPADPPPVEGTIIEPPPVLGGSNDPAADDDAARRAKRKSRRQSRYVDGAVPEEKERPRRKETIRSSEGSREDEGGRSRVGRRQSDMSGLRSFDARPNLAAGGKRESWFKKMGL